MSSVLVSPEYIGYRAEAFIGVFTPLQIIAVAVRFYARSLTSRRLGLDDWLVVASLFSQIVQGGIVVAGVRQGAIGYHVGYLAEKNPEAITILLKYLVAISSWYCATASLAKLAICVLYWRVFPQRPVYIALCITVAIVISTSVVSLIMVLAACRPFSANWAPLQVQAVQCINKEALFVWSTFPNIVTDVVMLILPLPIVWNLHTSKQLKFALTITFAVGSIGLVASILRFVTFANNNSFVDATYAAVELCIWTIAEPGTYLISACLLTYRPLLDKFHLSGSSRNASKIRTGPGRSMATGMNSTVENRRLGRGDGGGGGGGVGVGGGGGDARGIAMKSNLKGANGGFAQLPDHSDDWSVYGRQHYSPTSITVTTDIKHSWVDV